MKFFQYIVIVLLFYGFPCLSLTTVSTGGSGTFNAKAGKNVTIEVNVENDKDLIQFDVEIVFDANLLEPIDTTNSGYIPVDGRLVFFDEMVTGANGGSLTYHFINLSETFPDNIVVENGSGKLFSFVLRAIKPGESTIEYPEPKAEFQPEVFGGNSVDDTAGVAGGKVIVSTIKALINDMELNEGNSGVQNMNFTVSLDDSFTMPVTLTLNTENGTASTTDGDFNPLSGMQLVFSSGETSKLISVPVNGDNIVEADETFFVNLSSTDVGFDVGGQQGIGRILNDDTTSLSINDTMQDEGDNGSTTLFDFTVSLSHPSDKIITVDYATADDTGKDENSENDYQSKTGTLTFNPGNLSQTLSILVNIDTTVEENERFLINLSSPLLNGTSSPSLVSIFDGQGEGVILDDDTTSLSINNISQNEGDIGSTTLFDFTVSLSHPSDKIITVDYATADDTGKDENSENDYQSKTGTLTFDPGVLAQTLSVLVNIDTLIEPNERFFVNLSNAQLNGVSNSNLNISDVQGEGNILDDDDPSPAISSISRINVSFDGTVDLLNFKVFFSKDVQNVDVSDFNVTRDPVSLTPVIHQVVKIDDDEYKVVVNSGSGEGIIGIDVDAGTNIQDVNGKTLASSSYTNESFVIWEKNMNVGKGWNLLSFPGQIFKTEFSVLFPHASSSIWMWDTGKFSKAVNAVDLEKIGFWIYFPEAEFVTARGVETGALSTNLANGWNLVGVSKAVNSFSDQPIKLPIWMWQDSRYKSVQVMSPFLGYWIFASNSAVLN